MPQEGVAVHAPTEPLEGPVDPHTPPSDTAVVIRVRCLSTQTATDVTMDPADTATPCRTPLHPDCSTDCARESAGPVTGSPRADGRWSA